MTWNDQSLREMPLHAITQKLGMDGLHRRFEIEISRFDNTERADLSRALRLAERLHRTDQRANGEPYLGHVLRVAIRIASDNHYRVSDVHVLLAAVLHDTVEDHAPELAGGAPLDARGAALTVLDRDFGPRCSRLVHAVSTPPPQPDVDRHKQYLRHLELALAHEPWARVIKASDLTDNGTGVPYTTPEKARYSAGKYGPLLPMLRRAVMLPDTPLAADVKQHICGQIDLTHKRFTAILAGADDRG